MNKDKQPEALRLADRLENGGELDLPLLRAFSATKLRNQHTLITELVTVLKQSLDECIWPNARLSDVHEKASVAISKAEAQQ